MYPLNEGAPTRTAGLENMFTKRTHFSVQPKHGRPLTSIPHEPVRSCRGGAGFSLPIRAKLGLFFFRASASTVLQDLAFFASLRLCANPFPHANL